MLEVLILENNRLGTTGSTQFWVILGELPNLRVLNLNNNGIRTLAPLIPINLEQYQTSEVTSLQSASDLLKLGRTDVPKFNGFSKLVELHLIMNALATMDDLAPIICLPKLGPDQDIIKIFSQSYNIVIADACFQAPKSNVEDEFIAIGPLNKGGGIQRLQKHQLKPVATQRPYMITAQLSKKSLGNYTVGISQRSVVPHIVREASLTAPREMIHDRQKRRKYQFTEDDLREIVKFGRIPPVRELVRLAEVREAQTRGESIESILRGSHRHHHHHDTQTDPGDETHATSSTHDASEPGPLESAADGTQSQVSAPSVKDNMSQIMGSRGGIFDPHLPHRSMSKQSGSVRSIETFGESLTSSMREIMYDPDHIDDTFLTGVHITGGSRRQTGGLDEEDAEEDASESNGSDSESDSDASSYTSETSDSSYSISEDSALIDQDKLNTVYPLPTTIQGSVRALRHALTNPVSYWRILEESYARPTFASLKHKTAYIT
eukprot:jgi/Hompol1/2198/HPOL_002079-RA